MQIRDMKTVFHEFHIIKRDKIFNVKVHLCISIFLSFDVQSVRGFLRFLLYSSEEMGCRNIYYNFSYFFSR